ncbi:MAG TPA: glycogen/starch/alpha-glucan phosphorylase [Candidatus Fimiplasma intestinipullorum]|uniref:Alpha-1,4 glucan phosphorylase n=1 Tax=Candidatus Fimiplasma intestinipullorum TaxID=2840825 RepID=A0A9D1HNA4_9FIRM|nr:glycogen/starch/alpha-glucan phosphorylase [Candidatus Fimiplasma intestinipullorum]
MFSSKDEFQMEFSKRIVEQYGRGIDEAHITEKFMVLESMVRDYASINWAATKEKVADHQQKQMHYFSMEFLLGRLLVNNMMNLGIYEVAKEGLADFGINIHELEELESDAGLGNGGLGRLAACFMDSLASMGYAGHGNTIRYEYGLFKQKIENGYQVEVPDQWMKLGNMWEVRKPKHATDIKFYGKVNMSWDSEGNMSFEHVDAECVSAVPYDMPIVGNDTTVTNTLRLWSPEASENIPHNKDFRQYIQEVRDISQTLYPDDSTQAGRTLRLKQQYFFVSAGLQAIVRSHLRTYGTMDNFHEKNVIQLNDTHPVLCIPELMRILMDEHHMDWDKAWNIVTHTMAYTNHTILSEALERWPISVLQPLLPRIYMIIDEINRRFTNFVREKTNNDESKIYKMSIIRDGQIFMAHLAIVGSFSVNGVAALHTEILKHQEMRDFYELYPDKFNNKTNGVTHRRWLTYANPELSSLINDTIGSRWIKEPERLVDLMDHVDDPQVQERFLEVKKQRKQILADYIREHNHIDVDVNSIFDVQVKRLHAYKRQLLNILHVMYIYREMKENPEYRIYPRTFIFGAKAAASYYFAKKVIKLINTVADVINNDPETNAYLKVVFLENYGVTLAEKIMPAADVSEQISTAGKEASGTGNMKFMMNGALTLGTLDGANVEISQRVGEDNCVIFGLKDNEVIALKQQGYRAWDYYHSDYKLQRVVDSLMNGSWGVDKDEFRIIFEELMNHNDEYMLLADFHAYKEAQEKVQALYQDRQRWAHICLVNIAQSGYFSSDRTIQEYIDDIWHIEPVKGA